MKKKNHSTMTLDEIKSLPILKTLANGQIIFYKEGYDDFLLSFSEHHDYVVVGDKDKHRFI